MMADEGVVEHDSVAKLQKRAQLSAAVKQNLCEFKRQNPQATQEQITDYVYQKFSIKINRSTVAKILKQQEKWLSLDTSDAEQANKKRMRAAKHQGLEAGLYEWFEQQEYATGARATDNQVIARAIELAQELGIQDTEFKASQGWLANFKKRFNIKPRHPIVEPQTTIHIVQHPQGVPAEALHAAEAHAALAHAHLLPGALEQFQTHALQIHYARALPMPPPPTAELLAAAAAVTEEDISNKTAHLCAQQVRTYILKNPALFTDEALKAIEEVIEKIARNACYGQPELQHMQQ